jgi:hypothetical protein
MTAAHPSWKILTERRTVIQVKSAQMWKGQTGEVPRLPDVQAAVGKMEANKSVCCHCRLPRICMHIRAQKHLKIAWPWIRDSIG